MGGTNAHVILEQAPGTQREPGPADGSPPWLLSARSEPALREQAARLRDLVAADPSLSSADIAYSLLTTRSTFEHRTVVLGRDHAESLAALDAVAAGRNSTRAVHGTAANPTGPVVFVFPGQGSQWAGMGRRLYCGVGGLRHRDRRMRAGLGAWVDWSLVDVVTGVDSAASLDRVDVVQPALFAVMVSLARVWRSLGVAPDVVVGHSQGEIAAACAAGALSLEDAARIVALAARRWPRSPGGPHGRSCCPDLGAGPLERWRTPVRRRGQRPASVVISGGRRPWSAFAACGPQGVRVRLVKVGLRIALPTTSNASVSSCWRSARAWCPDRPRWRSTAQSPARRSTPRALVGRTGIRNLRSTVRFGEVVSAVMSGRGACSWRSVPHPVLAARWRKPPTRCAASRWSSGTLRTRGRRPARCWRRWPNCTCAAYRWPGRRRSPPSRPRRIALPTYAFQRQRYWLTAPDDGPAANGSAERAGGAGASAAAADLGSPGAVLTLVCAEAAACSARRKRI